MKSFKHPVLGALIHAQTYEYVKVQSFVSIHANF